MTVSVQYFSFSTLPDRSMDTENAATDLSRENSYFEISPQYADDITWASTAKHRIDHIKETIPGKRAERNLRINK